MKVLTWQNYSRPSRALLAAALLAGLALIGFIVIRAGAATPLSVAGYLGFSYAPPDALNPEVDPVADDVTGTKPESKLWWNDGFWWASMYNRTADAYHIYRLNWGTQDWEDTGVTLDTRRETQADVLWDEAAGKLYVVSHVRADRGSSVNTFPNWGHFFRYTYDAATQTYTQDPGFPVAVNEDKGESLVIDKDSTGRLWVTYVSRENSSSPFQVYVNTSDNDGDTWATPFVIPDPGADVAPDDLSSVIAFEALGQGKIGVMWSNQVGKDDLPPVTPRLFFAVHDDDDDPQDNWTVVNATPPGGADDHINIKSLNATDEGLFAAIKTTTTVGTDPGVMVAAVDTTALTLSFHEYSTHGNNDTQPILLIHEDENRLYVFATGKPSGSKICYKTLAIQTPLNTMGDFPAGDCGTPFIEDLQISKVDNATSTKQNVNDTTGIAVLAANSAPITDTANLLYVHNVLGDPPPVVTNRSPGFNATDVLLDTTITATFSKAMNASTINSTSFTVANGGAVAGTVSYNPTTRTATFDPTAPLTANTTYTVALSDAVQDATGQALFGTGAIRETWSFTTGTTISQPIVSFNQATYTVNENAGVATVTVQLNAPATTEVSVDYDTEDLSALAGQDYTAAFGTLTFPIGTTTQSFDVDILDNSLDGVNKEFKVTLDMPTNATIDPLASEATVQIVDDDLPPTVQFSAADYIVTEAAGQAVITVNLSGPSSLVVEVDYATSDGSANAPDDYNAEFGTLEFAPGQISKTFTVTVKDDGDGGESDETVNLTLSNAINATLGTPNTATLTIVGVVKAYLPFVTRP